MIVLGGCLQEAENIRMCRTSSLKTGRGHLRNFRSGAHLKLYLNPLHKYVKNAKKWPTFCHQAHTTMVLTIYHRIDSEYCSQYENSICDRMLPSRFILKLERNTAHNCNQLSILSLVPK